METSGFNVRNITKQQMGDDEFRKKCHKKYNDFSKMRHIVIDTALNIENILSVVILHFLVGTDYSRHALLREFIFDAEFCSFMQKRKMLSMIFDIFPSLSEVLSDEESKDLRRQINELILNRDKFAHGNIFIDAENDKVIIQYYSRGEKETEISPEVISEITKSADFIEDKLHVLNDYFRANRLEIEKEEF